MIPGNKLYFIPSDSKFVFGVLTSQAHNAWMRMVSGRLKADYNYGNTIVYNNFVKPTVNEKQKVEIERLAQAVLDACAQYPGSSLADLYDPDNAFLYPELAAAHEALDRAVERLYGLDLVGLEDQEREERIVAHLFTLYQEKVATEEAQAIKAGKKSVKKPTRWKTPVE